MGFCRNGGSNFACGTSGAACQMCGMGDSCNAGTCGPPPDAGTAGAIGSPCMGNNDCPGGFCIPESTFIGPTGIPGGYCSAQCDAAGGCPTGAVCTTQNVFGANQQVCMAECAGVGTPSTCRTGYVCTATGTTGYCRSDCGNGSLAACPTGQTCDVATGLCN